MRKTAIYILCLLLVMTMIFSACKQREDRTDDGATTTKAVTTKADEQANDQDVFDEDDPLVTPPGTFPIAKEKVTFKVFTRQMPSVADFENNEFTKWYEELTNVHLEWDIVPGSEVGTKLNLILAGGDYPDMFLDPWAISGTQAMIYGAQGVFIRLNDLLEKYGIETKKMLSEYPLMKDIITMPDGNIYTLPEVDDAFHGKFGYKMWVYQPWMDKLGLQHPETTEDFYEVLKRFRDEDLNDNGDPDDEVPLVGYTPTNGRPSIMEFIMNAFIYTDSNLVTVDNGNIDVVFNKPEWKEGLAYMKMLYEEGLIAPETFTQDSTQLQQLNAEEIKIGFTPAATPWASLPQFMGDPRWTEYDAIKPLIGPNGLRITGSNHYGIGPSYAFAISKTCKHPAVAFRWMDALYEQEMTLRKYYGRPDQEWRYAEPGEIGINGKQAIWASLAKSGGEIDIPTDKSWAHIAPHYRSAEFREGQVVTGDPSKHTESVLYRVTLEKYFPYAADVNMTLPPLIFTEEQSAELADLDKTIKDYVYEMFARFITGDADLDAEWDSYVNQLERMNLKRWLEINQEAYDSKWRDLRDK